MFSLAEVTAVTSKLIGRIEVNISDAPRDPNIRTRNVNFKQHRNNSSSKRSPIKLQAINDSTYRRRSATSPLLVDTVEACRRTASGHVA